MARTVFDPLSGREVKHDARAFHAGTAYGDRQEQLAADRGFMGKHGLFKNAVLPTAAFVAAPFALGAATGGAALPAAATQGVGFSAAPAVGGGMTLGNFLNIANLGVGGLSSWMGQRSQNKALDRQMALQQQEINARLAADAETRAEQKRQFDAQQANIARQIAVEDEDRAYRRRLDEERESRMGARRAYADQARARLAAFLGLR